MPRPRVVPPHLEELVGLAAAACSAPVPKIPLDKARFKVFFNFLKHCTPQNVYGLALAHARALENVAAFAAHLERLGCRCGAADRGAAHVDICPLQLRRHPMFQAFDFTAVAEPAAADAADAAANR